MTHWDWRVTTSRIEALGGALPLANHRVLLIQHALPDLAQLVRALVAAGCRADHLSVLGIPYSSRAEVKDTLETQFPGIRVSLPRVFPFDGFVAVELLRLLAACESDGSRLIILEDGGYAVPLACQFADAGDERVRHVVGAVEQTTRGANIDKELHRRGLLRFPVVTIPDCALKQNDRVEPPAIAAAVNRNLRELIVSTGQPDAKTVGVIGLGAIGLNVARHQKAIGARVFVNDYDPRRVTNARLVEGFGLLTSDAISECDLLIGGTGGTSIGPGVLPFVKDGVVLASASSRQIEIDVSWLQAMGTDVAHGGAVPCVMEISGFRTYAMKRSGRRVTLLYDGYPVNFCGESLPDNVGDVVLCLLFEGVLALTRLSPTPMIYPGGDVLSEIEHEIAAQSNLFP